MILTYFVDAIVFVTLVVVLLVVFVTIIHTTIITNMGVQRSVYVFLILLFVIVPKSNHEFLNRPLDTLIVSFVGVQRSV